MIGVALTLRVKPRFRLKRCMDAVIMVKEKRIPHVMPTTAMPIRYRRAAAANPMLMVEYHLIALMAGLIPINPHLWERVPINFKVTVMAMALIF